MIRFDWDGLHVGDRVLVHLDDASAAPSPGEVTIVNNVKRFSNDVGIRVGTGGPTSRVVWPSRLAVHADPKVALDACWRCGGMQPATKASEATR